MSAAPYTNEVSSCKAPPNGRGGGDAFVRAVGMMHDGVEGRAAARVEVAGAVAFHAVRVLDLREFGAQQPDHRRAGRESLARGVGIVDVGGFPIVQGADDAG